MSDDWRAIREEHDEVRSTLRRISAHSEMLLRGDITAEPLLRRELETLRELLRRHHQREQRAIEGSLGPHELSAFFQACRRTQTALVDRACQVARGERMALGALAKTVVVVLENDISREERVVAA